MKAFLFVFVVIIAAGSVFYVLSNKTQFIKKQRDTNQLKNMRISSPEFQNNGEIPKKYTCDQDGTSLPLKFSDIPAETKSLALIMDDPDAPMTGGFAHWVVFNMNPATSEIAENMKPESGIEGTSSSGKNGYVPPCPPSGAHHYHFKLYALDSELNLDGSAKREDVEKAMQGHIVEQAELIGLYQRQ
jgi:Raf kinase inhibitor-like YbhB/YbcL family protein